MPRDDFPLDVQDNLADRVGLHCSKAECDQPTRGPRNDPSRTLSVGVAAHITAASPGGPRYDPKLTADQRRSAENGIWLCHTCSRLVDGDPERYPAALLRAWKAEAEARARVRLEARRQRLDPSQERFVQLETLMPALLEEMAADLARNPFARECALLKRVWGYSTKPDELLYYYDEHPHLDSQFVILRNHGLVRDITTRDVTRYAMNEDLANYLRNRRP